MRYPLSALLTPDPVAQAGEGFTVPAPEIEGAMPFELSMAGNLTAKITLPLGLARQVIDMTATTVVDDSPDQWEIYPSVPTGARLDPLVANPRFIVKEGSTVIGVVPFVSGHRFSVGNSENKGERVQMELLNWKICLGNIRERGNCGTTIGVAYRQSNKATDSFEIPPVHPYVVRRQPIPIVIYSVMEAWPMREARPKRGRHRKRMRK